MCRAVTFSAMRLFQRRRREEERATKPPKLTDAVPTEARGQIGHALADHCYPNSGDRLGPYAISTPDWVILNEQIKWVLTRAWGVAGFQHDDVRNALAAATNAQVLDMVESWFPAMRRIAEAMDASSGVYHSGGTARVVDSLGAQYRDRINDIFEERDVAWYLAGERIVPRSSAAMQATIIEPVFALTEGQAKLAGVETAFQDALRELKPGGDPRDAITDAGTALQEMLKAVGAKGNALGPLLTDARKRGLLAPYDSKIAEAIDAIGDWVSADRSSRGDAHEVKEASRDDAWLAVRVAGALILRLAAGRKR